MPFKSEENFVYYPAAEGKTSGELYTLKLSDAATEHCFVSIPYTDPQNQKTKAVFYQVDQLEAYTHSANEIVPPVLHMRAATDKMEYIRQIKALKEQIQQGNIYEINYCIEFYADNVEIDPWQIFARLQQISQAPYAMLAKLADDFILCTSPELFLKKTGTHLSTKPIKGTAKRGTSQTEDFALKEALQCSLKERTENVMAVDVARNDLSMLAAKGTVAVNKLYNIETFKTVHQMVSTVSCELKSNPDIQTVLAATFPMASMTGAPKLSAMYLIGKSENFERRFYSGAMGMMKNGDYELCVVIRSIFYNQKTKRLSFAVGGAITYLSDPEKEYEECLLKAKGMLSALNATIWF